MSSLLDRNGRPRFAYPLHDAENVGTGFARALVRELLSTTKGGEMYIGGGVLALIVIIALLIWLL
jgi:hypothetical protein